MEISKQFLDINPYSRPGKSNKPEKIVIHYVGNAGSSAQANRNYFNNLAKTKATYASSQYIIGLKGEIIQCIPENEIAYHAAHEYTNTHSIGIEVCHPDGSGKYNDLSYKSLLELCVDICKRYNLDPDKDIIRHYDVPNGKYKQCPYYYVKNPSAWTKLKADIKTKFKPVDQRHIDNVNQLVKMGIISEPEKWYDLEDVSTNNVKALINNVAKFGTIYK